MQTPLDADAAALPHAGLAAGLRDLTLALFWSDAAAGVRGWRPSSPPTMLCGAEPVGGVRRAASAVHLLKRLGHRCARLTCGACVARPGQSVSLFTHLDRCSAARHGRGRALQWELEVQQVVGGVLGMAQGGSQGAASGSKLWVAQPGPIKSGVEIVRVDSHRVA